MYRDAMMGGRFDVLVIRASECSLTRCRRPCAKSRECILRQVSPERAYQLVVFSREEIHAFDLPRAGEVTIGRDEASAVRIDDPSVSRQHAVLRVGEILEIEDLGGANGTFVRQTGHARDGNETLHVNVRQLLGRKASLAVGDCLLFGTACVVVRHTPRIELPDLVSASLPGSACPPGVVLNDPAMRTLYLEAARVARSNINVLLLGETGVGKEVLARAIHAHSPRAKGPFMGVNCAALADSLLESELFGSEKGAFTGALARAGLFEAAAGGTVFLDEVGELPLATQAKLLRVLEERVVTRLGSTRARPIEVRLLSATNRDVETDSRQGRLRPDLYFRLNGVALVIPPLRERPQEIEALATSFLSAVCRDLERESPPAISSAALDVLRRHAWPGNVRELRNAVERAAVMCTDSAILPEHLPPSLLAGVRAEKAQASSAAPPASAGQQQPQNLQAEIKSLERTRILEALERSGGNQSEAARHLGIPRRTLVSRLTEFGLTRRRTHDDPA
jgi:two-component system response regulator AtoC